VESLWFEDFEVGAELETPARVVGEEDIRLFAEVSGDRNPLHLDDDYAAKSVFGGRVAHGLLGTAVASGLLNRSRLTAGTLIALVGLEWRFRRAIRPGAAVRLRVRVLGLRASREPDRGVVRLGLTLLGEDGEADQEGVFTILVRRRASPPPNFPRCKLGRGQADGEGEGPEAEAE
jgi:acyl dehydratase